MLIIVNRFSRSTNFVLLQKIPLLQNVFRLHGDPRDIVSNRGPKFMSRVWRSFCLAVGASVSLYLSPPDKWGMGGCCVNVRV